MKLVELWLDHNPLCDYFKDQPTYIRSAPLPGVRAQLTLIGSVGACLRGGGWVGLAAGAR